MRPVGARRGCNGMTLVELMVALLIGMVLSLAVFGLLSTFEGRKRAITTGNDLEQAGQIAMYKLDNWVRSAGAGLAQAAPAYGCTLHASKSGATLLPAQGAAGLANAPLRLALADIALSPVLVLPQANVPGTSGKPSDALIVMSAAPAGTARVPFSEPGAGSVINLLNSVDLGGGDLVLVGDTQAADDGSPRPCLVQQVAAGFHAGDSTAVLLDGPYQSATPDGVSVADYGTSGFALRLGNASDAPPHFQVLAVGDNDVLYSYDLLSLAPTPLRAEAEGVFELHAMYGVDTDDDGKADTWVSPSSVGYRPADLSSATPGATARLRSIKSVRIGLLTRTNLPERDIVTPGPLVLFDDLGTALRYSRTLQGQEQHYRYRTIEETVPVRNNLLTP